MKIECCASDSRIKNVNSREGNFKPGKAENDQTSRHEKKNSSGNFQVNFIHSCSKFENKKPPLFFTKIDRDPASKASSSAALKFWESGIIVVRDRVARWRGHFGHVRPM